MAVSSRFLSRNYLLGLFFLLLSFISLFTIKNTDKIYAAFTPNFSPASLKRLNYPSFEIKKDVSSTKVKPRWKRRNRALISHIPHQVGAGLGHRFLMLNYEVMLSADLEVGYVHRRSRYGSLTPDSDRLAVDKLFGFSGMTETRDMLIRENCETSEVVRDLCNARNVQCLTLRQNSTFERLVQIPTNITECYIELPIERHGECARRTRKFAKKHKKNNTLFQTTPSRCYSDFRTNNWKKSLAFLHGKYWNNRRQETDRSVTSLRPSGVSIAVHIRRGDFFAHNRTLIPDSVYACLICDVKASLDREVGASVVTTAHIYSEGVLKNRTAGNHDVSQMYPIYVTENGTAADSGDWNGLLKSLCPDNTVLPTIRMHIASDTIMALHDMISADIFIGSRSGMSAHIVGNLARGIVLLPNDEGVPLSGGTDGRHLKYSWYRNSRTAVIKRDKLDEKISEFARRYEDELTIG